MMVRWRAALDLRFDELNEDFSDNEDSDGSGTLREACVLALAKEKGYVIVDASALESAAIKNVARGGGLLRLGLEIRSSFKFSKNRKVSDGLSVSMNVAE